MTPRGPSRTPKAKHPEQRQDRRQVHRPALDERVEQVALDQLDREIDQQRPQHHGPKLVRRFGQSLRQSRNLRVDCRAEQPPRPAQQADHQQPRHGQGRAIVQRCPVPDRIGDAPQQHRDDHRPEGEQEDVGQMPANEDEARHGELKQVRRTKPGERKAFRSGMTMPTPLRDACSGENSGQAGTEPARSPPIRTTVKATVVIQGPVAKVAHPAGAGSIPVPIA